MNQEIKLTFDKDKLDALEFSLRKRKTTVQASMAEALHKLYEDSVPEAVREYLDGKKSSAKPRTKPQPKDQSATAEGANGQ